MDKIRVYNDEGIEEEKEIVLLLETDNKNYVLYKDIEGNNKKIYASYFYRDSSENDILDLNNDLTEEEYTMLEEIYKKGSEYDG